MGFFYKIEKKEEKPSSVETNSTNGCEDCELKEEWVKISSPKMPLYGKKKADLLIVGEGPGSEEDTQGRPFVGQAGQFLRPILPYKHLERLAWTNAVRCRPPGNRTPTRREVFCCNVFFEKDIEERNFKAILGLGSVPLQKFIPEALITNVTGIKFPVEVGNKVLWYFPTFHPSFVMRGGGIKAPQYPVFEADIKKFFSQVDKWKPPIIERPDLSHVVCALTEEEARSTLAKISRNKKIGFDIETNALYPWQKGANILTVAVSDGDITVSWPVDHPSYRSDWGRNLLFETLTKREWVAHNATFELNWLIWYAKKFNFDWEPKKFGDSMALGRLYYCRSGVLSLGMMSRFELGIDVKKLTNINTSDPVQLLRYPLEQLMVYNGIDAWACIRVENKLRKKVQEEYYQRLLDTILSNSYMHVLGLPIDLEVNKALGDYWSEQAREAAAAARVLYEAKRFEEDRQKEFNIGSSADVGFALATYGKIDLPRTPKGTQFSTDDETLAQYAEENPLAKSTLNYRHAQKIVSTYIDSLRKLVEKNEDGMLHPTYSALSVVTYRLQSSDPNAQNFPKRRDKGVRSQIVPPPGHLIVAFDSGQIQARIYAMASEDEALCKNFINKEDIHQYWLERLVNHYYPEYLRRVSEMTGETEEKAVWKGARTLIKSDFTFASFFGSSAESCSEGTGIPLHLVKEILREFWERYPKAQRWLRARRREYQETGGVFTLTGQFRYGVMTGNEPVITPIQNGESLLILGAQNELSKMAIETGDMYLHPRINIHDDLTFILPEQEDKLEGYINVIAQAMVKVRFPWQIVPLTVEVQIGPNWGDLEEVAVITGDYVR